MLREASSDESWVKIKEFAKWPDVREGSLTPGGRAALKYSPVRVEDCTETRQSSCGQDNI